MTEPVHDHSSRRHSLTHPEGFTVEEQQWGRLVWMVNGAMGSSETMTIGRCFINPGQANPRHYHPNCDEVLHVLSGTIEHSVDDETFPMTAGDIVSIPRGSLHNARNVGDDVAEFLICFDTADRQTVGE
jgi:quercetin dioxygenase-like cupin family protein